MDIIDIIISILVLGAFSFLGSRKKKSEENQPSVFIEEESQEEPHYYPGVENEKRHTLEDFDVNISKSRAYYTDIHNFSKKEEKIPRIESDENIMMQDIDNEEENFTALSFSEEDFRKGIIFHEILKRPNY